MEIVETHAEVRFEVLEHIEGVPAKPGQFLVVRDDGEDGRITVRVGDTLEEAENVDVYHNFDMELLKAIVANGAPKEIFEQDVIDMEEVRARYRDVPRYHPTRPTG